MDATPLLALPLLAAAQAQKHVTHNEALTALDTLVQLAVLDKDRTDPPANPAEGDRYLIASAAPTGAWAGWAGRVVRYEDGAWRSFVARPGWLAYVADEGDLYVYGAGAWTSLRAATDLRLTRLGLGTDADAQNPFAAKLNTALWTARAAAEGGTGDLRLTLNKEAPGNTLSLLFQSGWSGRAEIGLAGSDDLSLKVSADGNLWREALRVERATGALACPAGLTVGAGARATTIDGSGRLTSDYADNGMVVVHTLTNGGITAAGHGVAWSARLGPSLAGRVEAGRIELAASGDYATAAGQSSRWVLRAQAAGALVPALTLDPVSGHLSHHDWKPAADNARALGGAASRWSQLYAGTGTISTSDAREKTALAPLTAAELAAAAELAREIGTFRFLSAIDAKGEAARHHVGLTVQRAMAILSGHGLDPFAYAFVCRDAWPASPGRPEIREAVRDDGAPTGESRVVQEAEPPRPAGERLGFRADQLALFLIRGQEARLAALEARAA